MPPPHRGVFKWLQEHSTIPRIQGQERRPRKNAARAPDFRGIRRISAHLPIRPGECRSVPAYCKKSNPPYGNHTPSNQRVESEYFASLRAYGQWIGDIDSAASFPVNPGDPAGRWQEMTDVHPSLSVIDGSFRDIAPDRSRIPAASFIGAAILKGLGKFRALTGLGPDFAVGDSVPTARLAAWFGQQPVSRSALTTGTAGIDDAVWVEVPRS